MKPNKKIGPDFLTIQDLAERWGMSHETLNQWRSKKKGPNYVKLGGSKNVSRGVIFYRIEDVLAFEKKSLVKTK